MKHTLILFPFQFPELGLFLLILDSPGLAPETGLTVGVRTGDSTEEHPQRNTHRGTSTDKHWQMLPQKQFGTSAGGTDSANSLVRLSECAILRF